ncbi:MAG: DciA family protein [Pseudomonadota bacterium]
MPNRLSPAQDPSAARRPVSGRPAPAKRLEPGQRRPEAAGEPALIAALNRRPVRPWQLETPTRPPRRWDGVSAKPIGASVASASAKALKTYGFSTSQLITDWAHIIGADLASACRPEHLRWPRQSQSYDNGVALGAARGATLTLRIAPERALDIQYQARIIADRINRYMGYRAIETVKLVQAPLHVATPAGPVAPPLEARPSARIQATLEAVENPTLRAHLTTMAAGVQRRNGPRTG